MIYLPSAPPGNAGSTAYHDSFTYNGQQVAYTVSWSRTGNVQMLAWDASHEYAESATDPYYLSNGNGSGWYGKNDYNYEMCDITNNFAWFDGYKMAQFVLPPGVSAPPGVSGPPAPPAASMFGPTDPNMVYGGGPLLTHPQVTNVYCAGAPNMDAVTNVLVGPYGNALASAYGVGSGTRAGRLVSARAGRQGRTRPRLPALGQLAQALSVSLDVLIIGGEKTAPPRPRGRPRKADAGQSKRATRKGQRK